MSQGLIRGNSVKLAINDLYRGFKSPLWSMTFYCHLFVGIIGGGGLGFWYALYVYNKAEHPNVSTLSEALFTYFPAIVVSVLIELVHHQQPYIRSFGIISTTAFVVMFLLSIFTTEWWQFFWSLLSSILAILLWWGVSGEKECFIDIDPTAPLGDLDEPLLDNQTESGWQK